MSREPGAVNISSGVKKGIIFVILLIAVVSLLLFLLSSRPGTGNKIIGEGDRAPAFTLTALDGKQVSLSDYKGKTVVLHFWATWCPPCVEEIPTIDKLYREQGKDIVVLAVSVDEGGAQTVSSFLHKKNLTLPVLLDQDHLVASSYGTYKFPETYILDGNGIVRFKIIGPHDWTQPGTIKALQQLATR